METSTFFDASLQGYVTYCLGFFARYAAIAGGFYLLCHVAFRSKLLAWRIQRTFPTGADIAYEIRWSVVNTACTALSTMLIYKLIQQGRTAMYFSIGEHGWGYFWLAVLACIVGYDTWIYWQHRWLHTPWLFRHVHSVHHRLSNPSAFAAFAQHPVETFMGNVYFILFLVFVPIHPFALAAAGLYMFVIGIYAHSGYEFYPRGWTRHWVLGWVNTSTHHNMHHRHVQCNYGNWFNCWDYCMGTNHPDYHRTFDAIPRRRPAAAKTTADFAYPSETDRAARRAA